MRYRRLHVVHINEIDGKVELVDLFTRCQPFKLQIDRRWVEILLGRMWAQLLSRQTLVMLFNARLRYLRSFIRFKFSEPRQNFKYEQYLKWRWNGRHPHQFWKLDCSAGTESEGGGKPWKRPQFFLMRHNTKYLSMVLQPENSSLHTYIRRCIQHRQRCRHTWEKAVGGFTYFQLVQGKLDHFAEGTIVVFRLFSDEIESDPHTSGELEWGLESKT